MEITKYYVYPLLYCIVRIKELGDAWMKVNKIIYMLLAFFLGGLGVHKFYSNKRKIGILYFVFCWTGIPEIIGIVEAILTVFKKADSNGDITV